MEIYNIIYNQVIDRGATRGIRQAIGLSTALYLWTVSLSLSISFSLPLIRPPSRSEFVRHPTLYGTFIDTLTGKRRSMKIN